MSIGEILSIIVCVGLLIAIFKMTSPGASDEVITYESSEDNPFLKAITEHRTYMVNTYIALMNFWIGEKGAATCYLTDIDENTVVFLYGNMEVNAVFDWNRQKIHITAKVYSENEGYYTKEKTFRMKNKSLPSDGIYKMMQEVIDYHEFFNSISPEHVEEIVAHCSTLEKLEDAAARDAFYYTLFDLMLLVKTKKFLKDKRIMKVYAGLMNVVMRTKGEDFLNWMTEKENEEK